MKLRVLGCSGGIGEGERTTSLLVDDDVLIDAGTGVGDLDLAALKRIDHVFVTHAHLDHVTSIPFLLDTVGSLRDAPLTVHALPQTVTHLRQHLFNWHIWPDFTQIPSPEQPALCFAEIGVGLSMDLGRGRTITPLPANHIVPAVGYALDSGAQTLVFTGDTGACDGLWQVLNQVNNLRYVIVETAFPDREERLAALARHLCPRLLAGQLEQLKRPAEIYITHLKAGEGETIMREVAGRAAHWNPRALRRGQVIEF
jgi:ribonuclease BN (tRNA processing enzyme)